MDLIIPTFFITILFIFSLLIAFIIRKRLIEKVMFLEIDENLKNLVPREFFYNILKYRKICKATLLCWIFLFFITSYFYYISRISRI